MNRLFDVTNISSPILGRFVCACQTSSAKEAKLFVAKFISTVRARDGFAELYDRDEMVFLETSDFQTTVNLAEVLNKSLSP